MAKAGRKMEVIEVGPTEAQAGRFEYEESRVVLDGQISRERVYRRVPVYVTMIRRKQISDDLAPVLGWYRDRWDAGQYSPLRDSLGKHMPFEASSGTLEGWRARVIDALSDVKYAEAGVQAWLRPTLRSIVLLDQTATEIARERFGRFVPGQDRIDRIVTELRVAAFQMLAQVRHIVEPERNFARP